MKSPLDYGKAPAPGDDIVIRPFPDGGLTVTIPPAAPPPFKWRQLYGVWLIVAWFVCFFGAIYAGGGSPRAEFRDVSGKLWWLLRQPRFGGVCLAGFAYLAVRFAMGLRHVSRSGDKHEVVAIARDRLYVCTARFPARLVRPIDVSRSRLVRLRLMERPGRHRRTREATGIEISVRRYSPRRVCCGRSDGEIRRVYAALVAAQEATAPKPS